MNVYDAGRAVRIRAVDLSRVKRRSTIATPRATWRCLFFQAPPASSRAHAA